MHPLQVNNDDKEEEDGGAPSRASVLAALRSYLTAATIVFGAQDHNF